MPAEHCSVVLVTETSDPHGRAVTSSGKRGGYTTLNLNLSNLRSAAVASRTGELDVSIDGLRWRIDRASTVWWRRAGNVDVTDLSDLEAQLVRDEAPHILRGSLLAAGVRWVDEPFQTARAETKQFQLAIAEGLGLKTPVSLVTNIGDRLSSMPAPNGLIAKPLSPGVGVAPYVGQIQAQDFNLVQSNPTLIQECVLARADLRIVAISGYGAWTWSRERADGEIDWRAADPHGRQFIRCCSPAVESHALAITHALGLTMSIQDWLDADGVPVFLEANPQGAFMFLRDAESVVVPPLVAHLTAPA